MRLNLIRNSVFRPCVVNSTRVLPLKSEFLDTIRRNLARINIWRVKVNGEPQEMFRPYYLATRLLMDLLKQHNDKGAAVIDSLLVEKAVQNRNWDLLERESGAEGRKSLQKRLRGLVDGLLKAC